MIKQWNVEDLGPIQGIVDPAETARCALTSVNDGGVAVGTACIGDTFRGFLIDSGNTIVDFTPTGVPWCQPHGINASGFVVGTLYFNVTNNVRRGFIRDSAGSISNLKSLTSTWLTTDAHGLSENGAVTGWSYKAGVEHAVTWGPPAPDATTAPVDVHGSAFSRSYGSAINDSGQIAGAAFGPSGSIKYTFRDMGVWSEISAIDPWVSWPDPFLSAGGVVLGTGTNAMPSSPLAFVYEGGVVTTLLGMFPIQWDQVRGISASGEVVGVGWKSGSQVALSWKRASGIENLNDRLPPFSGWNLREAMAISPSGTVIVGYGVLDGRDRLFRLRQGLDLPYYPSISARDIPPEWAIWILVGGRLGDDGIGIGPKGPTPVPPWAARVVADGRNEISEILRLLALADLSSQMSDPELRRRTQTPLFQQALERLRTVAQNAGTRPEFRDVERVIAPSPVTGNVPRVSLQPPRKRGKPRTKK
jgi:hypothetical protein